MQQFPVSYLLQLLKHPASHLILNTARVKTLQGLVVGKQNIVVMLFDKPTFAPLCTTGVADNNLDTEVLIPIGVDSKEEVDKLTERSVAAGGSSTHQPAEMKG